MADTISIRTDAELEEALQYLGVKPDARNRSAIIKEAVVMAARVKRDMQEADDMPEPTLTRVPGIDGSGATNYVLRLPGLGGAQ